MVSGLKGHRKIFLYKCRGSFATEGQRDLFSRTSLTISCWTTHGTRRREGGSGGGGGGDDFAKIPFSFVAKFWVQVTSRARGVGLGRFFGGPSIEPFLGGGLARGAVSIAPHPPEACRSGLEC